MSLKSIVSGLTALCLTACGTLSSAPPPSSVRQETLVQPCPPFLPRLLKSNGDLAKAYRDALEWGEDCRALHNAGVKGR